MALASYEFLFLSFLTFATTHAGIPNDHSRPPTDTEPPKTTRGTILIDYLYLNCSTDIIAGSVFQSNLNTLLLCSLSNATIYNGFNKTTVPGENPSDSVFGLFMCRGDVPPELCQQCLKKATQKLAAQCPFSQQALIWYDECMVRYSNHSFFSTVETRPRFNQTNIAKISNEESFTRLLFRTINKTADEAAHPVHPISDKKFATKQASVSGSQRLYCLSQCIPDLLPNDCRTCLDEAIGELPWCCGGRQGGRVLYPSCFVRYELYPFYRSTVPSSSSMHPPPWVPASNFSDADSQDSQHPTYLYHSCSTDAKC